LIGHFYRPGTLYAQETLATFDHDVPSLAEGGVIPYGMYDLQHHPGYVILGTSHDTSACACDGVRQWWQTSGQTPDVKAAALLLLCDGGGSKSARTYWCKADLEKGVQDIGVDLRVAHYPPYTSKGNPLEHRWFPHLTRACQGVVVTSVELVKELMAKAQTQTGLEVSVDLCTKMYATGRKVTEHCKEHLPVIFDDELPQWNYRIPPRDSRDGEVISFLILSDFERVKVYSPSCRILIYKVCMP
jgi:Rhodopirellula transposase DDE domain